MRQGFYIFLFTFLLGVVYAMQESQPEKSLTAAPLKKLTAYSVSKYLKKDIIHSDAIKKLALTFQQQIFYFKNYNNNLDQALSDSIFKPTPTKSIPDLLAMGANPNYKGSGFLSDPLSSLDFEDDSPPLDSFEFAPLLHITIKTDNYAAFLALLLHPKTDLEIFDCFDDTPLIKAIKKGDRKYIEKLLEYGANTATRNKNYNPTPLMHLCWGSFNAKIAQYFVNTVNIYAEHFGQITDTPLRIAITADQTEWVQWLIKKGAKVNIKIGETDETIRDNNLLTNIPLHCKTRRQKKERTTTKGESYLSHARSIHNNQKIIKLLIDAGAIE